MTPEEEMTALKEALSYAIRVIESYQMDVRNIGEHTVDMLVSGEFCNDTVYTTAIETIRRMRIGEISIIRVANKILRTR